LHQSYFEIIKKDFFKTEEAKLMPNPSINFYFWGDMLLRDFDETDKYMVNADHLLQDLSHKRNLTQVSIS